MFEKDHIIGCISCKYGRICTNTKHGRGTSYKCLVKGGVPMTYNGWPLSNPKYSYILWEPKHPVILILPDSLFEI